MTCVPCHPSFGKVQCLKPVRMFLCITFPSGNDGVPHNASLFLWFRFRVRVRLRVKVKGRARVRLREGGTYFHKYMHAGQGCQACRSMRVGGTQL